MPHKFCLVCAKEGKSCCSHENGGTFVTIEEALRIANLIGKNPDEVAVFAKDEDLKEEKDYLNYSNLYFREDRKVVPLAHKSCLLVLKRHGKDCIFLSKEGCILPRELKPSYCRLFPFWFRIKDGEVKIFRMEGDHVCLIGEKLKDDSKILKAIGESPASLKEAAKRLASEVKREAKALERLYQGESLKMAASVEKWESL
ncbi:MAG: hypothetical protein ABIB71_05215 [Candidatus Woesearchaeota archaeon]